MTYDAQGRLALTEDSGGRVSAMYHSVLADRRHVTLTFPRYEDLATDKYYGPVSYSVTNHAGKVEASGVIAVALAGSTVAPTVFIDESGVDPITAVDTGSSFGSVAQLSVSIYDLTGTQQQEQRAYFVIPSSLLLHRWRT
ncbi:MAG: hypothetical protein IPK60_20525 [Sandaracinaceae bacterium]|nr:hypothetical protein [Sandaracinaceae bacterium]